MQPISMNQYKATPIDEMMIGITQLSYLAQTILNFVSVALASPRTPAEDKLRAASRRERHLEF